MLYTVSTVYVSKKGSQFCTTWTAAGQRHYMRSRIVVFIPARGGLKGAPVSLLRTCADNFRWPECGGGRRGSHSTQLLASRLEFLSQLPLFCLAPWHVGPRARVVLGQEGGSSLDPLFFNLRNLCCPSLRGRPLLSRSHGVWHYKRRRRCDNTPEIRKLCFANSSLRLLAPPSGLNGVLQMFSTAKLTHLSLRWPTLGQECS